MNRIVIVVSIVAVGVLVVVSLLAQLVGGISIRSVPRPEITVTDLRVVVPPVVPGVPARLTWNVSMDGESDDAAVVFLLRTADATRVIGDGLLADRHAVVSFPCDGGMHGQLLMVQRSDDRLLAQTPVQLLSPGVECVLH